MTDFLNHLEEKLHKLKTALDHDGLMTKDINQNIQHIEQNLDLIKTKLEESQHGIDKQSTFGDNFKTPIIKEFEDSIDLLWPQPDL